MNNFVVMIAIALLSKQKGGRSTRKDDVGSQMDAVYYSTGNVPQKAIQSSSW